VTRLKAMKSPRLIPLLKMKLRAAHLLLSVLLAALAAGFSGCASTEPDNASVRPWNTPQGWENALGGMDTQHR